MGAIIFFVVLLAISFAVGTILEKNERNYTQYFKD
jgi:cytochrome c biogenesis protein ResB